MKKLILLASIFILGSCSSFYEEDITPFSEQDIKDAQHIKAKSALKKGTFHMQPVSSATNVRVNENIKLKKPNLPPYDVVYVQTDLEDILLELANSSGETVVIPQSVRGRKITLSHSGANFKEMLEIVLSKAGYSYNYNNGIWNITRYPVRNYTLEIGQGQRKGSLDTSDISSSSNSDSDSSSSSSSSSSSDSDSDSDGDDLETSYEDDTWKEVEEVITELIKFGDYETQRTTKQVEQTQQLDENSNLGNNFSIVDTENKQETTSTKQTIKESEVVIDDDNIEPWFKLTKSAGIITVRAAPEAHKQIEQYLSQLQDSLHRQIFVEVRIVGITESKDVDRGIQWTIDGFINAGFSPAQSIDEAGISGGFLKFSNSDQNLDGIIQNLASISDMQLISTPQILVRNNQVGYVKILNELAYITTETETETTDNGSLTTRTDTVHTKDVGTILSILPYIGKTKVQMRLRLSVSQQSGTITTTSAVAGSDPVKNDIPTTSSNILDQDMIIEYGRVYALGGYIEERKSLKNSYVPGFNQLPGFSELMNRAKNQGTKARFIIFVKINRA